MMSLQHALLSACGLLAILLAGPAAAQQAMMVFGGGYARDCYDAVKAREPAQQALAICNIAIEEENLSRNNLAATLVNRGIVYMREENYDRATKDYNRALALKPEMPETKINLGAMLFHMGRYREAIEALNAGVATENVEARAAAYYNRAISYERLGDVQRAYDDHQAALAIVPGYPPAVRQLQRFRLQPASQPGS
jgi:tetratricopeptide (TPR) repeat protein